MRRVPRSRGPWRAIFITLVVLAVIAVGADFGLRLWSESWLAGRVQDSLGLSVRPSLDIGGFPFATQVLEGRFDRARIEAESFEQDGLAIDRADLVVSDVVFSRGDLLSGSEGNVKVGEGEARVRVTDDAVSGFLQQRDAPVAVEFLGRRVRVSSTVSIGDQQAEAAAEGPLQLAEGRLVFRAREVDVDGAFGVPGDALSFAVPLPELVPGVAYERVRVGEGSATLSATLADAVFTIRPAE